MSISPVSSLAYKSKPVIVEGILIILIGMIVVGSHTQTDITFHDKYVLPLIAECYPENQSTLCSDARAKHGVPKTAQLELGNAYWNELMRQAVMSGVILFVVRLGFAFMIRKIRKVRITSILIAIMWGATASGLFLFGFLDTFYYWMQGDDVPIVLDWLNQAGVFTETKSFTGTPENVEIMDLYLTNLLGLIVIGSLWMVIVFVFADAEMKNRWIA